MSRPWFHITTSLLLSLLLHSESRPQFFVRTPLLYCAARRDLSFRLRPHFCFYYLRSRLRLPFSGRNLVCGLLPSQVSNLIRDLKLMSRPLLMFISLLLVATSILCCNQFPPSSLYSRSRPQGDVATSCCSFSCRI